MIIKFIKPLFFIIIFTGTAVFFLRLTTPPEVTPDNISGWVRYVVDGDSLYINKYKPQIRLWGVDAPEKNESGFKAATNQLRKLAFKQYVKCDIMDTDHYGRTVARCFLKDGNEINRRMIESGTAQEYMRFSKGFYSH